MSTSNVVVKLEKSRKQRMYIFFAFTSIVLALVLLGVLLIQLLLKNERYEIENHITQVAKQSAIAVNVLINGDFQTLNLYAQLIEQNPSLLTDNYAKQNLKYTIKNTRFYSVGLVDLDGNVTIYDSQKGFIPPINVKEYKYFQESIKGNRYMGFLGSYYDNDKLIVLYSVPVIINGQVKAILTGAHSAQDYTNAIDITAFNDEAVVHIVDGEGNLVLRDDSPYTLLQKSIFEYNDVPVGKKKKALKATQPVSYWFKDVNGVNKVAAFIPIGYNNWKILAILPFSSISHNTNSILRYTVVFFLIINLIVIIGARYIFALRQKSTNMIMDIALKDDVTGSLNKTSFYLEGEKILLQHCTDEIKLAVLVMDIDGFKIINEVYNTRTGDDILRKISNILSKNLIENSIYARLNDDVFAIMCEYQDDDELILLIKNICDEINSIELNIKMVPSFGIYKLVNKDVPINKMIDNASLAKRTIKGLVDNNYAFYNEELSLSILADKEIEAEMKSALENGQFVIYLQPKIDIKTMSPCGSEALIRWQHPTKGLISPNNFIPLFERNGFIVDVDKYMWEQACKVIRSWLDNGLTPLPVSVNISRIHFKYENLVDEIENLVNKYNIPKSCLELELTESAFLNNEGAVNSTILRLQELGYVIAMDDFGMGYSSLNMLRKLPVNVLKLDRGFINEATCTQRGFIVLNHVVQMARDLNAKVVCEGIESSQQVSILQSAGCDIAQGFYYAKPMPVDEYNNFVYNNGKVMG
ncbi:EAL domain-containing protein [bacterium]|nr:EAL domain-containing protein [bacterium]